MRELLIAAVIVTVAACCGAIDVSAAEKDVTERTGALSMMGEVFAEAERCPAVAANVDAIDQYGRAFGIFLLSNDQDNLAVREQYKKATDAIEKFGLDCNGVWFRYGPEGKSAIGLVAAAGSIQSKPWKTANPTAYTNTKTKLQIMEKLSLVYAAVDACGFKVNQDNMNIVIYDNKIEMFSDSYDMRWIASQSMGQASHFKKQDAEFRAAICKGIKIAFGADGSDIPGLLK